MSDRPDLQKDLDSKIFRSYYYLKEELTTFCRAEGLPVSGRKKGADGAYCQLFRWRRDYCGKTSCQEKKRGWIYYR